MPGNELGDRVHNFFAQDNPSQGQHESHVLEGNWPVHNNNFWVGSHRQIDSLNSSIKNFSSQNSEIHSGQPSYPVHAAHGLNFSPSNQGSKSQSLNEQQYSNGFIYGDQFYQTRQNESNSLALDTDSDQRYVIASRGFSVLELQQGSGHEQPPKSSDKSLSPVSFDLFGGQQQMSNQQANMLHLQHQQSGLNDMQQLQKQLMLRKMQGLRQSPLQQLDLRHQNLINQVPPVNRQAFGSQCPPNSDSLQYPWTAEPSAHWLTRASSVMQGSPGGVVFPPNLSQTPCSMGLVPQQVDQSLYGIPVSNSRGLAGNQYPQIVTERSSIPQITTSSNSLHGNQHNFLHDRSSGQEGTSMSGQKFQCENNEYASSQSLNTGTMEMGFLQQVNSLQKDPTQQDFAGKQKLATRSETSHEKSKMQISSSQDEVTLDPTEEKILYGLDDNIWSAFGKSPNISREASNLFDTGGLYNGLLSIQSGSWSALMQSAVAETSSNDVGPQEEWSGLIFHNTGGSSTNEFHSVDNNHVRQVSLPNDSVSIPFASSSESIPPFNVSTRNAMGLSQPEHIFTKESNERVPTDISQRFQQSSEEATQILGNTSQNSLNAERNAKIISGTWAPNHTGTRPQPNGWSALAAVPPGGDRVLNIHEAEKESQKNNQVVMQGEVVHGSSLWKSSSVAISATGLDPGRSVTGNGQANTGVLSLYDTTSYNMGISDGARPCVRNNYLLNQWKNASPSAKFQGGEGLERMMDQDNRQNQGSLNICDKEEATRYNMENCVTEISNGSHHSSLSRRASGGFRGSGLFDATDSRSLATGKQKSTNQLASNVSVPRKFQYHHMGNLDEEVEPTAGLKQPTHVQAISMHNAHFGQPKLFGQISRNSMEEGEFPKDCPDKEPASGSFPGYAPTTPVPFSQPFDSYTSKASPPSQNMLELLHKVDQSRDHGSAVYLSTSECHVSSKPPEADKVDRSAQRSQHISSQGFGLQLGPPSQLLQNPDISSPSHNAQGMINSTHTSYAGKDLGEASLHLAPTSLVRCLSSTKEESQTEYEGGSSAGQGHPGSNNSLSKVPDNHYPASPSDTPHTRSHLQNQITTRVSGQVASNQHSDSSFSCNTAHRMQRVFSQIVLPDASGNLKKDNLATSVSTAEQAGRYGVREMDPAGTASTRDKIPCSQPLGLPGISQEGASSQLIHNLWTNSPKSQQTPPKAPSHLSDLPRPNILELGSRGDLGDSKRGHISSKSNSNHANSLVGLDGEGHRLKENSEQEFGSAPKRDVPLTRESSIKYHADDSRSNSASTRKDIEAFGRSLKPNIFSNEKFDLLNQMRALKDAENDPSIRLAKRLKVPDNILDIHQENLKPGKQNEDNVGDYLGSNNEIPSHDSRVLSFSSETDSLQRNTLPHGNIATEDIVAAGLHDSQSKPSTDCTAGRVGHSLVSPQMAPSWFNQYGSLKNWQTLPMNKVHKVTTLGPEESPVTLGNSASVIDAPNLEDRCTTSADACQVGSALQNSAPMLEGKEHLTYARALQPNVTGQHQVILRPKKRKSATSELHPWCQEIADGLRSLPILSVAEAHWSKAAHCLSEKVADDVELIEDGPPLLRSKRRLTLTAQLMQQLLSPPQETIHSADASSIYECVAFAVSRVALGDACSAISSSNHLGLSCDGMDMLSVKGKLNGDRRSADVIEDLLGKSRKLQNDFLRLDNNASILDLRLECQDLEKFSVINRFAKFHGRGQGDNSETSSNEATSTTHKPIAQRYVTAAPMPRSLPERVQCLSL